jgi:hypothetical protein
MPLSGMLWLVFLSVTTWTIVHAVRRRKHWRTAFIPALVCATAAVIVLVVPFTRLWLEANFAWHKAAREEAVRNVMAGTFRPNVSHNPSLIALGVNLPNVSASGNEIVVEEHDGKTYVFFFTFRGILDNYSGFVFVPDGGDPLLYGDLREPATELVRFDENWFFVSHR